MVWKTYRFEIPGTCEEVGILEINQDESKVTELLAKYKKTNPEIYNWEEWLLFLSESRDVKFKLISIDHAMYW